VSGTLAAGGLDGLGSPAGFGEDGGKAATRGVSERAKERKHEAGGGRMLAITRRITDNVPEGEGYEERGKMKRLARMYQSMRST
jgi:hypothetical protein